jgi:protoporphyrinogen oxidase
MKIAILGGGFTGLSVSYYLAKKGHTITLFEKENILGGLAVGFKEKNWNWYLERSYHHLFANDYDILNFAKETEFRKIIFRSPQTASLYSTHCHPEFTRLAAKRVSGSDFSGIPNQVRDDPERNGVNYCIFPLDTPQDFLRFPLLSWPDKFRSAAVLAFLKFSPFLTAFEKQTAQEFLKKYMGREAWNTLWQQLFRKKFGKYAGNILASFIWARIKKRTKQLGYVEGGFQTFIDYLEKEIAKMGVLIKKRCNVSLMEKRGEKFTVYYENSKKQFDSVVSTLPTAVLEKNTTNMLPTDYLARFKKLKYLHAVNLVLETKEPLLKKTYWLNVCTPKLPLMALVQHTNFMDKKNYGGNNILYIGWYVDGNDKLLKMSAEEIAKYIQPHLLQINSKVDSLKSKVYLFKDSFAQPIFDRDFVKNKPDFITPVKNFYIVNLDMTYPYDRGTNYAVKLGKQVSEMI